MRCDRELSPHEPKQNFVTHAYVCVRVDCKSDATATNMPTEQMQIEISRCGKGEADWRSNKQHKRIVSSISANCKKIHWKHSIFDVRQSQVAVRKHKNSTEKNATTNKMKWIQFGFISWNRLFALSIVTRPFSFRWPFAMHSMPFECLFKYSYFQ